MIQTHVPEYDHLEVIASEWLMLRPAGAPRTPAMKLVEDALTAAYLRRRHSRREAREAEQQSHSDRSNALQGTV